MPHLQAATQAIAQAIRHGPVQPVLMDDVPGLASKPRLVAKLHEQGLDSPFALLLRFPIRYLDKTRLTPFRALRPGYSACVQAVVEHAAVDYGRRHSLRVTLRDDRGDLLCMRLFYFSKSQQVNLKPGTSIRCYGEPARGKTGLELYHPGYQLVGKDAPLADSLEAVYAKIDGTTGKGFAALVDKVLCLYAESPPKDPLHQSELEKLGLLDCLRHIHQPPPGANTALLRELMAAEQLRLVREELTAQQLCMRQIRSRQQLQLARAFPIVEDGLGDALTAALPFTLTLAQRKVGKEIAADLARPQPMLRLLQGDVGSGKTLVALLAVLQVIQGGGQAALMVPTELLAEQHFAECTRLLAPLKVSCALLRGNEPVATRRTTSQSLAMGLINLIVGTHALFQQGIEFHQLGLVVVDEQHRFGVHQRMALRAKGERDGHQPHQLIMTATPIPRTLAMTAYANVQLSVIDQMPAGRQPIDTRLIAQSRRAQLLQRLKKYCQEGRQAYWVCRLVSESEQLDCESAETTHAELSRQLPGLRFGLVHGRCSREHKLQIMDSFRKGELDVLVATTVIELGIDVPSANVMVIENAEQLGLAQLHQLRGRVGRGLDQGYCLLLHTDHPGETARQRLAAIRQSSSGFDIAEKDLHMRGPGQLLGVRQSGMASFRLADLGRHYQQLAQARRFARQVTDPADQQVLIERWFADAEDYFSS